MRGWYLTFRRLFIGPPSMVSFRSAQAAKSMMNNQSEHTSNTADQPYLVAAFYKFVHLPEFESLKAPLLQRCEDLGLLGTILLAEEGINGTVSGPDQALHKLIERLSEQAAFAGLSVKWSRASKQPFYRMKVRLKKEIVSLGVAGIDPRQQVGEYVAPGQWNELIRRLDVRLIDTRNQYEYHLGTFARAEDPQTDSFRDFPGWVEKHLDPEVDQQVAMFCTGGIRCEKATAYLLSKGFKNVYHLAGGILNYLENIAPEDSLWQGDCFVFDNRVTVDHQLQEGDYEVCPACRMPLTEEDRDSPLFEADVSCPRCYHRLTPEKRSGRLERARQIKLAEQRGERHLGVKQSDKSD